MMKKIALLLTSALAGVLITSCGNVSNSGGSYFAYDRPATLPSNPSNVRVKVSTSHQMVYVLEGDKPLLVTPVSVGTSKTPTPKGNFRIFNKEAKRRANSHGYAYKGNQVRKTYLSAKPSGWSFKGTPMPYWCEFKSAYGFHTGWVKPYPCTHGCLRLHENIAPKFFRLVSNGTPVSIAHSQPEDATLGRNIPKAPDASPLPDYPLSLMMSDKIFTKHKTPSYR